MKPDWQPAVIKMAAKITKFITNESASEKTAAYSVIIKSALTKPAINTELEAARKTVSKIQRSTSKKRPRNRRV